MKKGFKRSLSLLLAITIIFGSAAVGLGEVDFDNLFTIKAKAASVSNLTFGLNPDGESYSVTYCDKSASGELTIPSEYNGKPVTNIGEWAFSSCISLKSITIPDSVTNIGEDAFSSCTSLTSVSLGNGVTSIDFNTFEDCTNLISIIIPDSVTRIRDYAFGGCTSLPSITIPDSVTNIGEGAFSSCTSLKSITIPDSVTNIGEYAFSYCISLTSVSLGNGVTSIDSHTFAYCTNLISITIPYSVTRIEAWAFSNCTNLNTVYYGGTEENWNEIDIEIIENYLYNDCLLNANIICSDTVVPAPDIPNVPTPEPDKPEYVPTIVNNGTFKCVDFVYSDECGFDYNDNYFYKPATEYNHELATMSLCLALSTFRDKKDSENSADNVISVLKQCGFKNEKCDTLTKDPDTDTIGYAIAKKQVDENTTLVVCAVRSGGYDDEWASNVTLGDIADHKGFDCAANQIVDALKKYIAANQIDGNVKFWLTGYSRGAASATQAAAKLIKLSYAEKEDVYAYGFATPAGAISDSNPRSSDYSNIHNILHFHDFIPRVAPKDWNFGWYGNVYYLPFKENDSLASFKTEKMREKLEKYNITFSSNVMDILIYDKDGNFRGSPGVASDEFVKNLAGKIESRVDYVDDYQYLLRAVLGEGITEQALVQVSKILIGIITGVTKTIICNNQNDVEKQIKEIEKTDKLDKNLLKVVGEIISATVSTHGTNGAYYLSWMQAMPDGSWLNNGDYRNILVNCPVDVYVYDSNGNLVAAIVNEETVNIENSPISYGVDENGQKVFYLPVDGEYDIRIEARVDCETTVTINEYTACSGTPEHVVTYTDVPMEADEVLESTVSKMVEIIVDDGTTETEAEYVVEKNDDVIEPNINIVDEEVESNTYTVNVSCDESKGVVYGGGTFTIGEFCQVTVENKPGYKFSKWTVNGETVSTESVHRFDVAKYVKKYSTDENNKNNVTLVAEYVPCEHLKYKTEVVAPTCTVDGYTKHTCEVCTYSYNDTIVKANGHSLSDWIIDNDEHTMYTECTICKEVIETKDITVAKTQITSCYNEVNGVQLKWNVVSGAKSYKVYRKLPSQTEWVEIRSTTALEYQDINVTGNTVYQYSVKTVDQYGNESDYSPQRECRFIETPELLSRTNAVGGVTIKWKKVAGATSYRIYRRGAGVNYWYYLGDFPATLDTFTDLETANYFPNDAQKNALAKPKSGNYYRYTVRASYDGEDSTGKDYLIYSGFDTNGLYLKYVATPKLTSISNATNGLQIKWNAVAGGGPVEYRVYRRGAGSTYWYYLGTTTNITWTDSGVKVANGGYYRYTVRAVAGTNGKGWYSAFDTTGLYLMRLANPTLNSAVSSKNGITVKWSAVQGTTGYYVYRKTANSGWVRIAAVGGTNNTTYLDKTAKKGVTYTYTVRAVCGTNTSYFNSGISCKDKY